MKYRVEYRDSPHAAWQIDSDNLTFRAAQDILIDVIRDDVPRIGANALTVAQASVLMKEINRWKEYGEAYPVILDDRVFYRIVKDPVTARKASKQYV